MTDAPLRTTCWTVIFGAGSGDGDDRRRFVDDYGPAIREYLAARWRHETRGPELEDAVQDVWLECLREGGALARAHPERTGRFRPFLFGVVRNVARRYEEKRHLHREVQPPSDLVRNGQPDERETVAFDRAWARTMIRQARAVLDRRARAGDELARRRVELLRERFEEDRPVRRIASDWGEDAARLHHQLADAKRDFRAALREVIAFHVPGSPAEIDAECRLLLPYLADPGPERPGIAAANRAARRMR